MQGRFDTVHGGSTFDAGNESSKRRPELALIRVPRGAACWVRLRMRIADDILQRLPAKHAAPWLRQHARCDPGGTAAHITDRPRGHAGGRGLARARQGVWGSDAALAPRVASHKVLEEVLEAAPVHLLAQRASNVPLAYAQWSRRRGDGILGSRLLVAVLRDAAHARARGIRASR